MMFNSNFKYLSERKAQNDSKLKIIFRKNKIK